MDDRFIEVPRVTKIKDRVAVSGGPPLFRKALLTIGFLTYTGALLGFRSTTLPAAAVSVYEPALVPWGLLLASTLVGGWVALSEGPFRALGAFLAVLSAASALAAPYIMGTFSAFSKDTISHIRRTTHTIETGQFGARRYAGLEALVVALVGGTGGSVYRTATYYPMLSKALFVAFTGYLVAQLSREEGGVGSGWASPSFLVATPIFGGAFAAGLYPEIAALHVVPFVAGVAVLAARRPSLRTKAVLFLSSSSLVMFHPRMAAFGVAVAGAIYAFLARGQGWDRAVVPVVLVAVWLVWFLDIPHFGSLVGSLARVFVPEETTLSGNAQAAAGIGFRGLLRFGLVSFSPLLLVGVASLGGIASLPSRPRRPSTIAAAVVLGVGLLGLGAPVFLGSQALSRGGHATVLILAVCLLALLSLSRSGAARPLALAFLLLGAGASIATVHRSPLMLQSSWHVDHGMVAGSQWITDRQDGTGLTAGLPPGLVGYPEPPPVDSRPQDWPRLTAHVGAYPPDASPSDWFEDVSFVVIHSRTEARCQHPIVGQDIVVGTPDLHRPSFCKLLTPGATSGLAKTYDSQILEVHATPRS